MRVTSIAAATALMLGSIASGSAADNELCLKFGPQAPRDITARAGANPQRFSLAPPAGELNLCTMHFHAQAEHKGPGFTLSAGEGNRAASNATKAPR